MASRVCFLIGTERSGTNLLLRILNQHSKLCGPPPLHLFRYTLSNLHHFNQLHNPEDINNFIDYILELYDVSLVAWKSNPVKDKLQEIYSKDKDIASIFNYLTSIELKANNKEILIFKEAHLHRYYDELAKIYPDAQYIYIIRDPRDMALSLKKAPMFRGGIRKASKMWNEDQLGIQNIFQNKTQSLIPIKYEDLTNNPHQTIKSLCEKINIPFEENMLSFFVNPQNQKYSDAAKEWKNISKPILKSNTRKFLKELDIKEIGYIEWICNKSMLLHNYDIFTKEKYDFTTYEKELQLLESKDKVGYQAISEDFRKKIEYRSKIFNKFR